MTTIIVGAGLAGLACARTLHDAGEEIVVFEKSRGLGGRIATRRTNLGPFDHGAQYATVRDPAFQAYIDTVADAGQAALWPEASGEQDRMVGLPGMSALVKPLAADLDIQNEMLVTGIARIEGGVRVETDEGVMDAERAVIAVPAPQATTLLEPFGAPFDRLKDVAIAPCWTLMIAFDERPTMPPFQRFLDDPVFGWWALDSDKPNRPDGYRAVLHASPDWSQLHLEEEKDEVAELLLDALADRIGELPERLYTAAHRWRYSQVTEPVGEPFLIADDGAISACGDGCLGGRVEAAYLSGLALGRELVGRIASEG